MGGVAGALIETSLLCLPFFALVGIGWAATRRGWVPLDGIATLNTFVLFFGLPAMLFRFAAGGALRQPGLSGLLLVYGVAGAAVASLALWWAVRRGLSHRDGGLLALATAFPNTGFLGLPLLMGLLGVSAAGPVAATLIVDVLLLSSVCLMWAHRPEAGGRGDGWAGVWRVVRGALRNPLLWSLALGMAWAASGWALPRPVDDAVRLLAEAASPAALFTLGAMLARSQMRPPWQATRTGHGGGMSLVALKLLVHPALVWLVGVLLRESGVPVSAQGLIALTLAAALPSASNVSMLAEREGADTSRVARLILWTTLLAWLSLSAWAGALGIGGQPG